MTNPLRFGLKRFRWVTGGWERWYSNQEKDIFTAALNIEKPLSIMEIVNLSCNLDKFRLWEGVQDTKQLGRTVIEREQELSKAFAMLLNEEQSIDLP